MKVLLDVKDNKADFVMELLGNFDFVKAERISTSKAAFMKELQEAMKQVALAKKGKVKLKSAKQLFDEL